jgi:RND family efflux transporter MFP subunit
MAKAKSIVKNSFGFIKSHKKLSIFLLVVFLIAAFFLRPKPGAIIETQTVKKGDLTKSISITGSIESKNLVNLTFQTGGLVNYLGAKEGESVNKGQAIVSLDKQKLEATYRQATQDFTAAKAASDQYYDAHTNDTESYDEKVRRTSLDAAQNKAYDQMVKAQKDLSDSTLYSPIEGILTKSGVQSTGVNITAATVFIITDPNSLDFKMDIDEADIGKIKIGQLVNVSLDTYPDENLELKIDSIDFVTHTTSTGGDAYTVKASFDNDNSDYKYRVGMNGNAEIIQDKIYNVLYVPLSSIFDDKYVYVKNNKKYEKRELKFGLENDTDIEVKSGINEGDQVVLDPSLVKPQSNSVIPFLGK